MTREIKRNTWSKFCKQFSTANRYRKANIQVSQRDQTESSTYPLLGMSLLKKGRLIDGIQFYTGSWNAEKMTEPVVALKSPSKVVLEKDNDGRDSHLTIETADGIRASFEMIDDSGNEQYYEYIEKIAYSLYENRGYSPGADQWDWYEAERRVKETEAEFV